LPRHYSCNGGKRKKERYFAFEVITAVTMKSTAFWFFGTVLFPSLESKSQQSKQQAAHEGHKDTTASNSSVVACVFVTMGKYLPSRCLKTALLGTLFRISGVLRGGKQRA
jgi:hypothetical protein